ncbi:MAG: hypothetical protein GEU82_00675 [Luteitalea sp.]|nr:hypothetical protein [Luteitalea sp.]
MKCPKCGFVGFEAIDRCRHCGYDFSFTPTSQAAELRLRSNDADDAHPLPDLALADSSRHAPSGAGRRPGSADLHQGPRADGLALTPDLPLFAPTASADQPLVSRPSQPRQPLSVRRATPDVARLRTEQRPSSAATTPLLDLDATDAASRPPPSSGRLRPMQAHVGGTVVAPEPAAVGARVLAVVVDLIVLAVTDLVVIYFTMQICGLTPADIGILPKGPLIAFLLVQNGAYLVTFTAGGQTLGKMAAGIRVVSANPHGSVDLGHSVVRTIVWALLATPAGLGFVTALFSRDHRGLHDRCAGTRVVRATV